MGTLAIFAATLLAAAQNPYQSDPGHPWNVLHNCLLVRQTASGVDYGADPLDPPLWANTKHLLTGDSHRRAIECLDRFLAGNDENAIRDPLRRAVLQHDLWAIFDWAAIEGAEEPQARSALEQRLAAVMRRIALTPEQIRALPDTYHDAVASRQFEAGYDPAQPSRAFLPPDLFRSDGPWVCMSGYGARPTAVSHFSGRSLFLVFLRLPGGRDSTLGYVHRLRESGELPLITEQAARGSRMRVHNLKLEQIPVGTQVALVRQMILLDSRGELRPTGLIESVQIRVYHAVTPGTKYLNYINGPASHDQDFFEFRFSRPVLFSRRQGGLLAVTPDDTEYLVIFSQGIDPFESPEPGRPGKILATCRSCHSDSGIHSVNSTVEWIKGKSTLATSPTVGWETKTTLELKQRQRAFRLLKEYWSADERNPTEGVMPSPR